MVIDITECFSTQFIHERRGNTLNSLRLKWDIIIEIIHGWDITNLLR